MLEGIKELSEQLTQVTIHLLKYPGKLHQFVKRCLDAKFLSKISFLEVYRGIKEVIECQFDKALPDRLCLEGLGCNPSSVESHH